MLMSVCRNVFLMNELGITSLLYCASSRFYRWLIQWQHICSENDVAVLFALTPVSSFKAAFSLEFHYNLQGD